MAKKAVNLAKSLIAYYYPSADLPLDMRLLIVLWLHLDVGYKWTSDDKDRLSADYYAVHGYLFRLLGQSHSGELGASHRPPVLNTLYSQYMSCCGVTKFSQSHHDSLAHLAWLLSLPVDYLRDRLDSLRLMAALCT